jgi:hypothetical protein
MPVAAGDSSMTGAAMRWFDRRRSRMVAAELLKFIRFLRGQQMFNYDPNVFLLG